MREAGAAVLRAAAPRCRVRLTGQAWPPRDRRRVTRAPPPAGSVPASWATPGSMTRLAALHLGRNALMGSLPVEWGTLPRALPRLAVLGLQDNRLSGTLPPEWGAGFAVRARCPQTPLRPAAQAHGGQAPAWLIGGWFA